MTAPDDRPAVLAELRASPPRRVVGVGVLLILGAALLYLGLSLPVADLGWTVFLLGFGGLSLWLSLRMWTATEGRLVLTADALCDAEGRVLARVDMVRAVNRGVFAFKPAGGFTLVLSEAGPRAWAPGLWWRIGRRVGVGGVTHRHEARYMAEVLDQLRPSRGGKLPD
ncbi:MAG: hypothetical protein JXR75_00865 [Rhodobacteraceae bacterium]|nr:hypothetical protein [Paracoccaceae bacterium]